VAVGGGELLNPGKARAGGGGILVGVVGRVDAGVVGGGDPAGTGWEGTATAGGGATLPDGNVAGFAVDGKEDHAALVRGAGEQGLDVGNRVAGFEGLGEEEVVGEGTQSSRVPLGRGLRHIAGREVVVVEPEAGAVDAGSGEGLTLQAKADGGDPAVDLAHGDVTPQVRRPEVVVAGDPHTTGDAAGDRGAAGTGEGFGEVPLGDAGGGQAGTLGDAFDFLAVTVGEGVEPGGGGGVEGGVVDGAEEGRAGVDVAVDGGGEAGGDGAAEGQARLLGSSRDVVDVGGRVGKLGHFRISAHVAHDEPTCRRS
jgi:hypothetical protein